jgi:predicted methyltransferase
MEYSKEDEDFIKKRSRENLVEFYREEFLKVIDGHNCGGLIPLHVRRRLRKEGILKKFGSKYTVTQLGREMLSEEASNRLVQSRGGGEG